MLGKLLKHEFIATGRILSILFAVLLIISPTTALYLKISTSSLLPDNNLFLDLMEMLCIAAFVISMIAAGVTTVIVLLNRFYQSMITRESYLTHTLPVKTSQLVISKLITAVIWQVINIIVMTLSLSIFLGILGDWSEFVSGFHDFTKTMAEAGMGDIRNILVLIIMVLISIMVSYMKCYASFAFGHMFNGHPLLGFIVSYIAITTIVDFISSILLFIFNMVVARVTYIQINEFGSLSGSVSGLFNITVCAGMLYNLAWGVIFYIITVLLFRKKLNI